MVTFSKFSHKFILDDSVALYHSLRMKPVYLSLIKYQEILKCVENFSILENDFPENLKQEIQELINNKILITKEDEDEKILSLVRSKILQPSLNVCYLILSEQCNLACKYCFLGNNNAEKRKNFALESMSKETAETALLFFINRLDQNNSIENKPVIIFYGGEPLINFEVLEYVALRIKELKPQYPVIENVELSVVTNGVLLDKNKFLLLKELNVGIAISIDGCTEAENIMRVDKNGNNSFFNVIKALDIAKENGVDISLSITLTEETIKYKQKILELLKKYKIKGLGFNILMSDETFSTSENYNNDAAQFIIEMFVLLREIGIYEDRIMRKLKSFSKAQIYFSDCAATSGSQIVIAPDGAVGICHGCLADRNYFVSALNDNAFDVKQNQTFVEWSQLTPVNKEICLTCEALGICGGGCPINALRSKKGNTINSLDERFCVHAKRTLEFLIKDLYRIIKSG